MAVKAPPRKLTHSGSRRHMCGYSIGVSTVFISTLLCMFIICFFFLDMEMFYRKAGFTNPPPVVLQTHNYGLGHSASESLAELINSTSVVATPAVEVISSKEDTDRKTEEDVGGINELREDASPAQVDVDPTQIDVVPSRVDTELARVKVEPSQAENSIAPEDILIVPEEGEDVTPNDEAVLESAPEGSDSVDEVKIKMSREPRSLVGCDITQGQWVYDNVSYPLYHTRNCPFADPGFRCEENGRPDKEWMSYHWKPHDCDLPRFNATDILERLRGQRVVFVGDSLGRNNWESMLCMLAEGVSDKSKIYEVNGEPITKHSGKLVYRFVDYNCTVEYYRDPFLVPQTRPPKGSPSNVKCVLRVDHVSWSVDKWWDADIIIFNAGHWWTEHKIFRQGCRFQEGNDLKLEYDVPTGLGKALRTWATWLEKHLDPKKSEVFWLSFPTVHFR
ncbi:hypothetical protein M758_3G075000 [Ceratodon purpureus]|nr:hypothetical protein M758_3G075000 [Ceratodon purpureus]